MSSAQSRPVLAGHDSFKKQAGLMAGRFELFSLTFVVARLVRAAEQANIAQSMLAIVLGIAGGAFFHIDAAGWICALMDLNPIAAFIRGLGITAAGGGLADLGAPLAIMLGFAAAATLASRLLPDRSIQA
jgi:ABC-2 type transport system permease protein